MHKLVTVDLSLCNTVVDHTAILLLGYLKNIKTDLDGSIRLKQTKIASDLNTSIYKVSTAIKTLEQNNMITVEQKRNSNEVTRGVPSYIYKVIE